MNYKHLKNFIKKYYPLIYFLEVIILKIISKYKYINLRGGWIICEREDEAKDNGYNLFNYINNHKINNKTYYVINKNSTDYKKIKQKLKVIHYGSYKHKIAYILSQSLISTHYHTINPWKYCDVKNFNNIYFNKLYNKKTVVFLQHGIIYNDVSDYLGKKNTQFDLFICGAKKEYNYIKEKFGYSDDEVVYTGLSRFDNLSNKNVKNQILFMPTWRMYLSSYEKNFSESNYYLKIQEILDSKELISLLEFNDYKLIFYPHSAVQKHIEKFSSISNHILIAKKDEFNIQQLLIESKLLITDYSSVFFDFAFMEKPVIYYQFDKEEFFSKHYNKGYFDYEKHGFGNIVDNETECIKHLKNNFENNFIVNDKFEIRINNFFGERDNLNNKRIIEAINNKLAMKNNINLNYSNKIFKN